MRPPHPARVPHSQPPLNILLVRPRLQSHRPQTRFLSHRALPTSGTRTEMSSSKSSPRTSSSPARASSGTVSISPDSSTTATPFSLRSRTQKEAPFTRSPESLFAIFLPFSGIWSYQGASTRRSRVLHLLTTVYATESPSSMPRKTSRCPY